MKKNIAIIVGGDSVEQKISIKSGENFYKNVNKKKFNPFLVFYTVNKWFILKKKSSVEINEKDFSIVFEDKKIFFNGVVIMIHGSPGETGELCNYFESLNIPYSSSNQKASELTFNKFKCNKFLKKKKILVPISSVNKIIKKIKFPCIVKPINSGSSFGVSKIKKETELRKGIEIAKKIGSDFMIEEFISGRELTCAVHNLNENKITTLPITEIITEREIFDYEAKYLGLSKEITPAKINERLKKNIEEISKNAYRVLNLNGIVRFDFIIKNKVPYLIEVNTIPGFSQESIVPKMIIESGKTIKEFTTDMIEKITLS